MVVFDPLTPGNSARWGAGGWGWGRCFTNMSCSYRVKASYPEESGYVDKRKKELDKMWKDLMDKANDRKRKLQEQAERLQFDDSAKELVRL